MARAPAPGTAPPPREAVGAALASAGCAGLRLNVGCGDRWGGPGWTDCDSWPGVVPDACFDCTRPWPFPTASADRIYLGQVIEHLDYPQGVRACLLEAARVLAPDGTCCLVTPDFIAHAEKRVPSEVVENERTGRCRWPGDEHRWWPDRHVIGLELERAFGRVVCVNHQNLDADWPRGGRNPWDCCYLSGHSSRERLET